MLCKNPYIRRICGVYIKNSLLIKNCKYGANWFAKEDFIMTIAYVISDGKGRWLKRDDRGCYILVKRKSQAEVWKDRTKATNILHSCVNKNLRKRFRVEEVNLYDSQKQSGINEDVKARAASAMNAVKDLLDRMNKWQSEIERLISFASDSEERRVELVEDLSTVDKEISDVQHYIELGKFNAYQGWEAFNLLRSCLQRRRKIKDELVILQKLSECRFGTSGFADIVKSIETYKTRRYEPRVLKELFE